MHGCRKDPPNWKQRMLYQATHVPYFIMLVLGIAGSAYDCARDYGLGTVAVVVCGVTVSCILAALNCGNRESCEKYAFGLKCVVAPPCVVQRMRGLISPKRGSLKS
jgi:hypothetical protein